MSQIDQPARSVHDNIDAAQKELDTAALVPSLAQHAVGLVGGINTAISQIDTISSTYLEPLKIFNTVVSAISNVQSLALA